MLSCACDSRGNGRDQGSRRLFGGRTSARTAASDEPVRARPASTPRRTRPPPKRESSRSPDHLVRQDLLAPVIPGREPEDNKEPNEESSALDVQDVPDQVDRLEGSTVRRRLLVDRGARSALQGQRSAAILQDDRQNLKDTAELDSLAHG